MKKKRRIGIRIDMTPMVDIGFLMLIFYMSTTQFKPPETKAIKLPTSHSQISLPDKDVINVTVTKDDSIFVDYIVKKTVNIDGTDVSMPTRIYDEASTNTVASLINAARIRNPRAFLVIKADKDSSYGTLEGIMKTMQEQNLSRFQIVTNVERDI
ncbi:MAG: biopolymer transporter ExbD [candidate division Zixibacteria bacterium]|nr:biopolymer transporter ExbD [candidate division Zixibacteria bacterium]